MAREDARDQVGAVQVQAGPLIEQRHEQRHPDAIAQQDVGAGQGLKESRVLCGAIHGVGVDEGQHPWPIGLCQPIEQLVLPTRPMDPHH
jgi:hypothetical protein